MIFDKLKNIGRYKNISSNIRRAIEYIEKFDILDTSEKELIVDGDTIYGFVRKFHLKNEEEVDFETHNLYTDIQVCLEHGEIIDHADKSSIKQIVPYDIDKDIEFGQAHQFNRIILSKGTFVIFFPNDAHRPCVKLNNYKTSCKLVLKIKNGRNDNGT